MLHYQEVQPTKNKKKENLRVKIKGIKGERKKKDHIISSTYIKEVLT